MNEMTILILLALGIIVLAALLIVLLVRQNAMATNLEVDIDKDIDTGV